MVGPAVSLCCVLADLCKNSLEKEKRKFALVLDGDMQTLMENSGKSSSGKTGGDAKSQSRSSKAGLQFPVGRIHRLLKKGNYAQRVGAGAPGTFDKTVSVNFSLTIAQYTSLLCSSTWPQRFLSWQVMLLVITRYYLSLDVSHTAHPFRNNVLSLGTFNSPSEMMKSMVSQN